MLTTIVMLIQVKKPSSKNQVQKQTKKYHFIPQAPGHVVMPNGPLSESVWV